MDILGLIVELFTNADHFLVSLATDYGTLIYFAMFLIFFLETGCVVMSFLPGDSLLFVAGTVAAAGTASPWMIMLAVIIGAILGNSVGYATGKWLGNKIYDGNIRWIDAKKLQHAHSFYTSHGGKTILLARFVPIVRAFAPLVAGAARMDGLRFELFSGTGAVLWAVSIIGAGYLFGNIPFIQQNLSKILILGIVAAVAGPMIVGVAWKWLQKLQDQKNAKY
ncbi:VTT domain-containing protein [Sutterella sp.]|uniref:VTT domain-containing protein n=1 Tax=Sutterella sp. TaxID=1981025 RepID=UPI0026E0419E|nr:VTT domain-containing protein [Sutterella sp.]MDO5531758.1 VTT domain-containing protein [Sutterella sp.]